ARNPGRSFSSIRPGPRRDAAHLVVCAGIPPGVAARLADGLIDSRDATEPDRNGTAAVGCAALLALLEAGARGDCAAGPRARPARGPHADQGGRARRLLVLRPGRRRRGGSTHEPPSREARAG